MDIYSFLFYFEAANALVLVGALLLRKSNKISNYLLSSVLLVGLFGQWNRFLQLTGQFARYPWLYHSGFPARMLFPALFYLYVLSLTQPGFHLRKGHLLHLLPFLLGWGAYRWGLTLWDENRLWFFTSLVSVIVYGVYLIACFARLREFRRHLVDYFSEIRRMRLWWLRILLSAFAVPWLVTLWGTLSGAYLIMTKSLIPVGAFIIILIGFFGLRQSTIFAPEEDWDSGKDEKESPPPPQEVPQPVSTLYTQEQLASLSQKLEALVREREPYLNPELRLVDLAKELKLKPYQVTEVLNRGLGTTFYEFINRHRVEEAKRRLKDPKYSHFNLLSIGGDSGFNSKSVFNDTFRKMTGMTPSAYRKSGP